MKVELHQEAQGPKQWRASVWITSSESLYSWNPLKGMMLAILKEAISKEENQSEEIK